MKLRIRYYDVDHASIETADGYYVADVNRCSEESDRAWKRRVRSVAQALSRARGLVTTRPIRRT